MVNVSKETAAFSAFMKWMQDAEAVRDMFQGAHLDMPGPLARFFGEHQKPPAEMEEVRVAVPAPRPPEPPPEWRPGWIWIPMKEVGLTSAILGALRRHHPNGLTPSSLVQVMQGLWNKDPSSGSVANTGTRLAREGRIVRDDGIWKLHSLEKAPVMTPRFAWGPPDLFETHEIAAHRRLCIEHLLKAQHDGLQIVQITRNLEGQDWVKAPVAKDLIKVDIAELQKEGKVRQMGHSRKWELTENGDDK
jgi:hypothetical protein